MLVIPLSKDDAHIHASLPTTSQIISMFMRSWPTQSAELHLPSNAVLSFYIRQTLRVSLITNPPLSPYGKTPA